MTSKLEQAARQLLEVAEGIQHGTDWNNGTHAKIYRPKFPEAITALQEALDEQVHTPYCKQAPMCKTPCGNSDCVEQAEQEPVAWMYDWEFDGKEVKNWVTSDINMTGFNNGHNVRPLYAAPVRTKDLTASEIRDIWNSSDTYDVFCVEFARAVIAADRKKNK